MTRGDKAEDPEGYPWADASPEGRRGRSGRRAHPGGDDTPPPPTPIRGSAGYVEPDYARPDGRDAGREILAAFAEAKADTPVVEEPSNTPVVEEPRNEASRNHASRPGRDPQAPTRPRADPPTAGTSFSMNVDFKPRTTTRHVLSLLILLTLAGTVLSALTLREDQNTLNVGVTAVFAAVFLLLSAVRASSPVSHLRVRGGMLEVKRGGHREVFDLSSRYTPMEVHGRPGRPSWKVILLRTDGMPQQVDASVVNPHHFTEVLSHYRPDLVTS